MSLKIKKVLNSSVVLAQNENDAEVIILGKGIGYGRKIEDLIDEEEINQVFVPVTNPEMEQIEDMISSIPEDVIDVTQKIVKYASEKITSTLNKSLSFSLMDHINFSLERLSQGMFFKNKLYWEVKSYYPEEFEIGEFAVDIINKKFEVSLPNEEAASIAFHVINAESDSIDSSNSMEIAKLVNEIMTILNMSKNLSIHVDTISYQRLITHIKFFAQRVVENKQLDSDDNTLYNHMLDKYPDATNIAIKVLEFLDQEYEYKITTEELTYLIVHIQRNMK